MWIFLNDSALSIVAHRNNPDALLVRARIEGDIDRVFPEARVDHTPEFDYAYRAVVSREEVSLTIASNLESIQYDNFKNSISADDQDRHMAYLELWAIMRGYQEDMAGRAPLLRGAGRISGSITGRFKNSG